MSEKAAARQNPLPVVDADAAKAEFYGGCPKA